MNKPHSDVVKSTHNPKVKTLIEKS